jgi:hypothetical protein
MEIKWPTYEVANDDAIYALGVVSINYARFERTHVWMLAAVANMQEEHASVFIARTNASDRANVIETFFKRRSWPQEAAIAIEHYITGMRTLIENRNSLIHANIVRGPNNQSGLFSLNRRGETKMLSTTTPDIRQVADDLHTYFNFGHALANYIATEIHHMAREAGMVVANECPPLPAAPTRLVSRPFSPDQLG